MFGYFQIGNARLDPHGPIGKIHIQHARHFTQADDDRVFLRNRPASKRCPRAARNNFDPVLVAIGQQSGHHVGILGQSHGKRHFPIGRQGVGFKGPPLILRNYQTIAG